MKYRDQEHEQEQEQDQEGACASSVSHGWLKKVCGAGAGALALLLASAILSSGILSTQSAPAAPRDSTVQPEQVELRGKVVCIPELMHELYQTELAAEHEHVYGFRTTDG